MAQQEYDLFAVTAHGLADLCASELHELGIDDTKSGVGGVEWRGDARTMYRANLELRTASRVIARVGEFRARGFAELERRIARLPWTTFLSPGTAISLRVTSRKSKLYHEGAIAERIARVLDNEAGVRIDATAVTRADDDVDDDDHTIAASRPQLVIVRFLRDACTISIDASGTLLHQRGYRQATAKAPLRETLAAALVLANGWRGEHTLIDPFCGSGTIPIEAALLARRIAPGIANEHLEPRPFAFEQWPMHDAHAWHDVIASARSVVRDPGARIIGSDRDAGAIDAARSNAERAGVMNDIELRHAPLSAMDAPAATGCIVTNPPYGVRIGDHRALRDLYAALGRLARERLIGGSVTMLSADDALAAATGLPFVERLATRNGGIPVRLLTADLAAAPHVRQDAV